MAIEVKHHCQKCGHAEPYTIKDDIIRGIVMLLVVLGILAILITITLLWLAGPTAMINSFTTALVSPQAYQEDPYIRNYTLEIIRTCGDHNELCYLSKITDHFKKEYTYVLPAPGMIYSLNYTIQTRVGDCKNLNLLVTSMLYNIGIISYIDCRLDYGHCISIAKLDNGELWIVDVTGNTYKKINQTDYWEEYYSYLKAR